MALRGTNSNELAAVRRYAARRRGCGRARFRFGVVKSVSKPDPERAFEPMSVHGRSLAGGTVARDGAYLTFPCVLTAAPPER